MELILLVFFASAGPGLFLALCGLTSIWLVFGRTHLAVRVAAFLLATLPLGMIVCLVEARSDTVIGYFGCSALFILAAFAIERHVLVACVLCFLLGIPIALLEYGRGNLDPAWLATTALALCLLAAFISILRLIGFRLVCFATDATSQDIYLATGRSVAEWIAILDEHGAASWKYSEIVIFLREFGFTYHWQKAITIIYEKSLGRRTVDRSVDGKSLPIAATVGWNPIQWLGPAVGHRFTIEQMMLWCVAAACFFGFFRIFSRFALTIEDFVIGLPVVLSMSVITMLLLYQCLAIRNQVPRLISVLVAVIGLSAILPTWIVLFPGVLPFYMLILSSMLGFAAWLTAALVVVRNRGYRLVRLERWAAPVYGAGVST